MKFTSCHWDGYMCLLKETLFLKGKNSFSITGFDAPGFARCPRLRTRAFRSNLLLASQKKDFPAYRQAGTSIPNAD